MTDIDAIPGGLTVCIEVGWKNRILPCTLFVPCRSKLPDHLHETRRGCWKATGSLPLELVEKWIRQGGVVAPALELPPNLCSREPGLLKPLEDLVLAEILACYLLEEVLGLLLANDWLGGKSNEKECRDGEGELAPSRNPGPLKCKRLSG